jgi:microcystin-dependent protein
MADPFVAEIRMFPFTFPPKGWAFCNGQILPISQNTALFALLGTVYGGDGKSTFALPNLQTGAPMHPNNQNPPNGLSYHDLGEQSGTETVSLLESEMPVHTHSVSANVNPSNLATPSPARSWARSAPGTAYDNLNTNLTPFAPQAITPAGSGLPHNNMMPYLVVNFCIAMQGIFPPRG